MNKEMIISVNAYEKRVAILEDGVVVEFYVERADESKAVVGNIYKGKVRKVLPGMQSAFVDIGLERDAFLYVGDFFEETEEDLDLIESSGHARPERVERTERQPEPPRREAEGRRADRERPAEATPERQPTVEFADRTTTTSKTPEAASTLSPLERVSDDEPSAATLAQHPVVDTPLLSSMLGATAEPRFERVSDELEDKPLHAEAHAPVGEQAPPEKGVAAVDERSGGDTLELEREALAESLEAGAQRERRRTRRKEVIGEEKKKSSRRRSKKVEAEVEALIADVEPPSSPPVVETPFERARDEDLDEEAGDLLKDALIQQKIIVQTRI